MFQTDPFKCNFQVSFSSFEHSILEFVSYFDICILDFVGTGSKGSILITDMGDCNQWNIKFA